MTGRYNYRTGVVDTYLGRSMMHADEVTLPECLARATVPASSASGIGDNTPARRGSGF